MEWLQDLTALAELPMHVLLMIIVVVLWRENKRLSDKIIEITEENLHMSTDNQARAKRIEQATTGDTYPTVPKRTQSG